MKIKVFHSECGREALVQQILDSGGHCPWDGKPYSKDYTANLAEALGAAEAAGTALERALDRINGTSPNMKLDEDSISGPIGAKLGALNTTSRAAVR